MKLSTKGRYGTRAMLELALHYGKGHVFLKEIAKKQEISVRYLEHIMSTLASSGLVHSTRGKQGGFSLIKAPGEIRLSQIIHALEGSISPVACIDDTKRCKRYPDCVTRDIWKKLKDSIEGVLDSITLGDMVKMHEEKSVKPKEKMYYI